MSAKHEPVIGPLRAALDRKAGGHALRRLFRATGAVVLVGAFGSAAAGCGGSKAAQSSSTFALTKHLADAPLAPVPLLASLPSPTKRVVLRREGNNATSWGFTAQVTRKDLCMGLSWLSGSERFCDSPEVHRSVFFLYVDTNPWRPRRDGKRWTFLYGVTSTRARRVAVVFNDGSRRVTVPVLRRAAIPHLGFFTAKVPLGERASVVAIGAGGSPIARTRLVAIRPDASGHSF